MSFSDRRYARFNPDILLRRKICVLNHTVEKGEAALEGSTSDISLLLSLNCYETFDQKYDSLKVELELCFSERNHQVHDLARTSKKCEDTKSKLSSTSMELVKYRAYAGSLNVANRQLEEDTRDAS